MSDDIRDLFEPQTTGGGVRLYPYAKDIKYDPSGILSMTLEIYDNLETQQLTFGFKSNGNLKEFLDQIYEGDTL